MKKKFVAFISYRRVDKRWAEWLQNRLEHYTLPSYLHKQNPNLPKQLKPNFRDTTDINLSNDLGAELRRNLDLSNFLVVISSPDSAKSKYVGDEIQYFIDSGRKDNIIIFIVGGDPSSRGEENSCIHPVFLENGIREPLGANVNEDGVSDWKFVRSERALIRTIARIVNVEPDQLWQRQKRRRIKQAILILLIFVSILLSLFFVWRSNQPFDMNIAIKESSAYNNQLPFVESNLYLIIGQDTIAKNITSPKEVVVVRDVANKYRGREIEAKLDIYGYNLILTKLTADNEATIEINRDDTYSKIKGTIRDDKTDRRLPGVIVNIKGREAISDKDGNFLLSIPLDMQDVKYSGKVTYMGKVQEIEDLFPTQNDESIINTLYIL